MTNPGTITRARLLAGVALAACACQGPASPGGTGPNIDGVYSLRLETTCSAVPEGQRVRTYSATIAGSPEATVRLSGTTFWHHPTDGLRNTFTIRVARQSLVFRPAGQLGIVEQVDATTFLQLLGDGSGTIVTTVIGKAIVSLAGSISGRVAFGEDILNVATHASCSADTGRMSLTFTPSKEPVPAPGVAHSITDIAIAGPESVAPNASAQFAVTATLTDGSTRVIDRDVTWRNLNTTMMTVTADGLVTPRRTGEDTLSATVRRPNLSILTRTREIVIVPAGTFRVVGRVTEPGSAVGLEGVRVAVATGPTAGLLTNTDASGGYRLYGVAPNAEIHLTRDGFVSQVHRVVTASHHTQDFVLHRTHAIPDLRGPYRLTIAAAANNCSSSPPLAQPLRERTYAAVISQSGPDLTVTLSGADFSHGAATHNRFRGIVEPRGARFMLGSGRLAYFSYGAYIELPDVIERQIDGTVLIVSGTAVTTEVNGDLVGTLGGLMSHISAGFPQNPGYLGWCSAPNLRFVLAREAR